VALNTRKLRLNVVHRTSKFNKILCSDLPTLVHNPSSSRLKVPPIESSLENDLSQFDDGEGAAVVIRAHFDPPSRYNDSRYRCFR
jgi:hypothetical protein